MSKGATSPAPCLISTLRGVGGGCTCDRAPLLPYPSSGDPENPGFGEKYYLGSLESGE